MEGMLLSEMVRLPTEGDCNKKSSPNISHNLTRYWTLTEHYKK